MNWLTFWRKADEARADAFSVEPTRPRRPDISEPVIKLLQLLAKHDKWAIHQSDVASWEIKWIGEGEGAKISLWGQDTPSFVVKFTWATEDENVALTKAVNELRTYVVATKYKSQREKIQEILEGCL